MGQRWDPVRDLMLLQDRMNRLFEDATRQPRTSEKEEDAAEIERADWIPAADVFERETDFVIALDLPGIERDSLDISVNQDKLVVRGERAAAETMKGRSERPSGSFLRKFGPLPSAIDRERIAAEYKDGVLRVTIPKRAEQKAHRIEIKIN